MKDIKIEVFHNGETLTFYIEAPSVQEVSKTLRGARDAGYYYTFENGSAMLIGSEIIRNAIIDIEEVEL